MALWTIRANYDTEAKVWYSIEGDIPGLAVDAETLEALAEKAGAILPDLLEIHAEDFLDKTRLEAPHSIRIIAYHERDFDVAA